MSEHSEIVHEYIELRNFLAISHPHANMKFDIGFIIKEGNLLAFSSVSKSSIELAKIQPEFFYLYIPHYGLRFENDQGAYEQIIFLSHQHKITLDLALGYEPKS